MEKLKLILASGSPRRKELLSWIGIPFEVLVSDVQEKTHLTHPQEVVAELARIKGEAVYERLQSQGQKNAMVVSSDTMVCLNDKIYGKPSGVDEAREILRELSGKTHRVLTSVCVHYQHPQSGDKQLLEFVEASDVEFFPILPDVLEEYLKSADSLDKAGAYGIQGQALTFIKGLNGSYSNVMGFPLAEFVLKLEELCRNLGYANWREAFV